MVFWECFSKNTIKNYFFQGNNYLSLGVDSESIKLIIGLNCEKRATFIRLFDFIKSMVEMFYIDGQ